MISTASTMARITGSALLEDFLLVVAAGAEAGAEALCETLAEPDTGAEAEPCEADGCPVGAGPRKGSGPAMIPSPWASSGSFTNQPGVIFAGSLSVLPSGSKRPLFSAKMSCTRFWFPRNRCAISARNSGWPW